VTDRPTVHLNTPWGSVQAILNSDTSAYVSAGSEGDANPTGITINRVPYRLQLRLHCGTAGWWGGGLEALSRMDGRGGSSPAANRALNELLELFAHWARRHSEVLAEAQTAYLERELARMDEYIRVDVDRLREHEGDRSKILAMLGREPETPPLEVLAAVVHEYLADELVPARHCPSCGGSLMRSGRHEEGCGLAAVAAAYMVARPDSGLTGLGLPA